MSKYKKGNRKEQKERRNGRKKLGQSNATINMVEPDPPGLKAHIILLWHQ